MLDFIAKNLYPSRINVFARIRRAKESSGIGRLSFLFPLQDNRARIIAGYLACITRSFTEISGVL